MSIFNSSGNSSERGRAEWSAFNVVREDHASPFQLSTRHGEDKHYPSTPKIVRFGNSRLLILKRA